MQTSLFDQPPLQIGVRWFTPAHIPDVLTIERACFFHAWTRAELIDTARADRVISNVAEVDGVVVGYHLFHMSDHSIRSLRFAVSPPYRRLGVARALLTFQSLDTKRRTLCDVREDHVAAHLCLRACGFRAINQWSALDRCERVNMIRFIRDRQPARPGGGQISGT